MAFDPRHLRPSVLTRMLNSTPLGEVVSERQLRRHRNRAGFRIGNDKEVDLFRYAAWLAVLRHYPTPEKQPADYEEMKEAARARNAALSALGRDIGPIPEVVDPARRGNSEPPLTSASSVRTVLPPDLLPALVAGPPEGDG